MLLRRQKDLVGKTWQNPKRAGIAVSGRRSELCGREHAFLDTSVTREAAISRRAKIFLR